MGYHYGGYYIKEVISGSIADRAGLQARDLIISVDGIKEIDYPYCLDRGKAKLADGQEIIVTIERFAQEGTIDLVFKK